MCDVMDGSNILAFMRLYSNEALDTTNITYGRFKHTQNIFLPKDVSGKG